MQHTPPRPTLQTHEVWALSNLEIPKSHHSFISAVCSQPVEQGPYVADVYSLASLRGAIYSQPIEYSVYKVNVHVFFTTGVHAFFSLRCECDFTIDAGKQRLLGAKQLNFWKPQNIRLNKIFATLDTSYSGAIQ